MTDQKPCPHCGCTVSGFEDYFFIPVENLRWHSECFRKSRPGTSEDQKEEATQ